jgi:hypothetical protein
LGTIYKKIYVVQFNGKDISYKETYKGTLEFELFGSEGTLIIE